MDLGRRSRRGVTRARKVREDGEGAGGWARAVRDSARTPELRAEAGVGRARSWAIAEGGGWSRAECVGKWAEQRERLGRYREKERGEGAGPDWAAGKEEGRGERMGWVVLGLGPLSSSISFSFANSHKLV